LIYFNFIIQHLIYLKLVFLHFLFFSFPFYQVILILYSWSQDFMIIFFLSFINWFIWLNQIQWFYDFHSLGVWRLIQVDSFFFIVFLFLFYFYPSILSCLIIEFHNFTLFAFKHGHPSITTILEILLLYSNGLGFIFFNLFKNNFFNFHHLTWDWTPPFFLFIYFLFFIYHFLIWFIRN
jgi:hypothetical protein